MPKLADVTQATEAEAQSFGLLLADSTTDEVKQVSAAVREAVLRGAPGKMPDGAVTQYSDLAGLSADSGDHYQVLTGAEANNVYEYNGSSWTFRYKLNVSYLSGVDRSTDASLNIDMASLSRLTYEAAEATTTVNLTCSSNSAAAHISVVLPAGAARTVTFNGCFLDEVQFGWQKALSGQNGHTVSVPSSKRLIIPVVAQGYTVTAFPVSTGYRGVVSGERLYPNLEYLDADGHASKPTFIIPQFPSGDIKLTDNRGVWTSNDGFYLKFINKSNDPIRPDVRVNGGATTKLPIDGLVNFDAESLERTGERFATVTIEKQSDGSYDINRTGSVPYAA